MTILLTYSSSSSSSSSSSLSSSSSSSSSSSASSSSASSGSTMQRIITSMFHPFTQLPVNEDDPLVNSVTIIKKTKYFLRNAKTIIKKIEKLEGSITNKIVKINKIEDLSDSTKFQYYRNLISKFEQQLSPYTTNLVQFQDVNQKLTNLILITSHETVQLKSLADKSEKQLKLLQTQHKATELAITSLKVSFNQVYENKIQSDDYYDVS